jgi:ABC-type transporter Mla maintaining outer membrane lipid asymmetry ATPase subunit MlaF
MNRMGAGPDGEPTPSTRTPAVGVAGTVETAASPAPSPPASESHPDAVVELQDATIPSLHDATKPVLRGVHWRMFPGEYWAIAGLARSGKTSLVLTAAGVLRPVKGRCRLFGVEFAPRYEEEHLEQRLKVGVVFDGGQLLHHLTLAENLALPLEYHARDSGAAAAAKERMEALIDFTDLRRWASSRPGDVNRNLQQRFGLARALALRPKVLLLDNPLSGLDPRDLNWWLETLDTLACGHAVMGGEPLTLAVTCDDLRPWRTRARQFGLVTEERFISVGSREDVGTHPEPLLRELWTDVSL